MIFVPENLLIQRSGEQIDLHGPPKSALLLTQTIQFNRTAPSLSHERMPRYKHRQTPARHRQYLREALVMVVLMPSVANCRHERRSKPARLLSAASLSIPTKSSAEE